MRLEPIAFDMHNGWLLTQRAQAYSQSPSIVVEFSIQYQYSQLDIGNELQGLAEKVRYSHFPKCVVVLQKHYSDFLQA